MAAALARCSRVSPVIFFHIRRSFSRIVAKDSSAERGEQHKDDARLLYDSHIPTSFLQKALLSVGSFTMSLYDPGRDDMIAVLGETTGRRALAKMRDQMAADEEGSAILLERPRINSSTLDYEYMKSLPSNTLGAAYLKFLSDNGVTPDSRQPVHFVDDEELAYVVQRYREVHDMVHTVLDMPTNILGEVAVKWVEAIHTEMPMCMSLAVCGAIRLSKKQRRLYKEYYLPWALKCGYESKPLFNIYYERHWDEPMDELRRRVGISLLEVAN